jgi:Ribonuclease E/G family
MPPAEHGSLTMHGSSQTSHVAICAGWSPGEVRIATVTDGRLSDYGIWRPGAPDGVGDIYRGRIAARMPAMAGAFVALSGGVEGFLPDSEGAKGLTEGTILTVRITRAAVGGKGPRLSARSPGAEPPHGDSPYGDARSSIAAPTGLVRRGIDPLSELAARHPNARVFADDPALVASLRAGLGERAILVASAFDDAIETELEALGASEVTLPPGVRLSVQPTRALVAIDIDGGGALVGRDDPTWRHRALNLAVLPELARQIRMRNLSGAILVDFAGLKAKQRSALGPGLTAALASDPLRPRFLGFTALGLAEITRPRVRAPLHEMLSGPHAAGLAALRAIAGATRAGPGARVSLRAAPAVIAALEADPVALPELARVTGRVLHARADPSLPAEGWRVEEPHG